MTAFWLAFILVFVAEMGDKIQFMTLTFSTRYSARVVIAGVVSATLVISFISAVLGVVLGKALPLFWINLLAGLGFIAFGLWSLRDDSASGAEPQLARKFGAVLTVALAFFAAEFGDRTMLATMVIAGHQKNLMGVWIGSSAGLICANILAILVGKFMGKRLPEKSLKYITAVIFVGSGCLALVAAWKQL